MSAQDPYIGVAQPNYPPRRGVAITPADGAVLTNFFRRIYVGGGAPGDLKVTMAGDGPNGVPVTLKVVPVGAMLDIQVCIVWATGTTASSLVGFFD